MGRLATVVTAITVGVILVIGVASAIFIQRSYNSLLDTERSTLAATAQVTAHLLTQNMTGIENVEQATLSRGRFEQAIVSGASTEFNLPELQAILTDVQSLAPEYQFAAVTDVAGVVRAIAPVSPSVVNRNFSYRDWYRGVMRTGRPYVSEGYVSAVPGAPLLVAVATPILAGSGASTGPIAGILLIGYKIGNVQSLTDRLAGLQQTHLQVTDQAGVILTRTGGIAGRLVEAPTAPELSAALAGRATTVASATELAAGAPVPGIGWTVSATTPISATGAASERTTASLIAAAVLVMLAMVGMALVAVTRRLEKSNARLAFSESNLRTILNTLAEGVQVFAPNGSIISHNSAATRMYELGDGESIASGIHEKWDMLREDGAPLPPSEDPLQRAMQTGATFERGVVGIRRRADGVVRWLSFSVTAVRDQAGRVSAYVTCGRDVTDSIETIRGLRILNRAAARLSSSLLADDVASVLTEAASELCSVPGELPRRAVLMTVDGDSLCLSGLNDPTGAAPAHDRIPISEHHYVQRVIESREALVTTFTHEDFGPSASDMVRAAEIRNGALVPLTRDGDVFAVLAVSGPQSALISHDQLERLRTLATTGTLAFSNADAHQLAKSLARTDPLTGAANRRALDDRLAQLTRTRFALVAIDVDHLKNVNDAHGHEAGDDLLRTVASAIAAELRPADTLARTGGDEFVVVLNDCDGPAAAALGVRLTTAVARARFGWGRASISVGTAAGAPGETPQAVARAADKALYVAKMQRSRPVELPRATVPVSE
jgi:diguanylate cyclase (GGDEF)-like protein